MAGRPINYSLPAWRRAANRHGGATRLAKLLQVTTKTLYLWGNGLSSPTGDNLDRVKEVCPEVLDVS